MNPRASPGPKIPWQATEFLLVDSSPEGINSLWHIGFWKISIKNAPLYSHTAKSQILFTLGTWSNPESNDMMAERP